MQNRSSFLFGLFLAIGILAARLISGAPFTIKTVFPAVIGGIAGGLAVWLVRRLRRKGNKTFN